MLWRTRSRAPLLLLLLAALVGCEPVTEPAPPPGLAPGVAQRILSGGSLAGDGTVVDDEGTEYTLVESLPALLPTLHVSGLLDAAGGVLKLAGHTLTVPAGAVASPTLFLMVALPDGRVEVELQALLPSLFGLLNVGGEGFDRPVTLSLSYARAVGVDDPAELRILHLREDGGAEALPTSVDPEGRTVTAPLEHFSRYCMAIP